MNKTKEQLEELKKLISKLEKEIDEKKDKKDEENKKNIKEAQKVLEKKLKDEVEALIYTDPRGCTIVGSHVSILALTSLLLEALAEDLPIYEMTVEFLSGVASDGKDNYKREKINEILEAIKELM